MCSVCGMSGPGYDTLPVRRFEFVPLWGIAVFFLYAMRRVQCPGCGIKVERVPWAEGKNHLTITYHLNQLIGDNGFRGEIGLLSVDIDGNDYWVWDRLDVVNPVIVVAEYNSVFGADHAITVPYDPGFTRGNAHYSHLYWGASLKALSLVADRKNYALVGCNSAGNNAFFVRRDRLNGLKELTAEAAYVESKFKESRDANGQLTFLTGKKRLEEIRGMPVHDVLRG